MKMKSAIHIIPAIPPSGPTTQHIYINTYHQSTAPSLPTPPAKPSPLLPKSHPPRLLNTLNHTPCGNLATHHLPFPFHFHQHDKISSYTTYLSISFQVVDPTREKKSPLSNHVNLPPRYLYLMDESLNHYVNNSVRLQATCRFGSYVCMYVCMYAWLRLLA